MAFKETDYNDKAVKEICYNCGSPKAKKSYNYFRRLDYVTGGKVWSKDNEPIVFFYANKCKDHVRLIEIAVKQGYQKQGFGRQMLSRLVQMMNAQGIKKITFRTPIKEEAYNFWVKMGAKIIDVRCDDYEMELNTNI